MAKTITKYVCGQCGAQYSSWVGRCSQCGEWNTISEEVQLGSSLAKATLSGALLRPENVSDSLRINDVRLKTEFGEIDLVLGGGLVAGGVVLMAGQPGIGKSTLLMQIAHAISKNSSVLYVSGEESVRQVGLRASRLGVASVDLDLANSNSADDIAQTIMGAKYNLVVVDSIQTMTVASVNSAPGSVSQITNSTNILLQAAKQAGVSLVLVGHVTKEGAIAGPKLLEHIVDVVLQLEGEAYGGFKVLRAVKNRFGPTSEAAILEMDEKGLRPVLNPSAALLAERQISDGSVVLASIEGTRPILVEVQALVNPTNYGYPKRAASGFDLNRLNLLVAVLEKRTKLKLNESDIYINIVGGIKIQDPAADLAVCMAIGSAAKGLALKKNAVVFGEVGLSGEIRHVPYVERRIEEAKKLGFETAIGPHMRGSAKKTTILYEALNVRSAMNAFLSR